MQYAESQRYRQRRGTGGAVPVIASFFQHKQLKNAQAEEAAYSNADKMMQAVASGILKPQDPSVEDVLFSLQHYDSERAGIFSAALKNIHQGNTEGTLGAIKDVEDYMRANPWKTQWEAIESLPSYKQVLIQMAVANNDYWAGPNPKEEEKRVEKVMCDRVLSAMTGAGYMEKVRALEYVGCLPEDAVAAIQARSDEKRQEKIEEANAKEQIEFDWAMKKHRAQKDYGFEIFQKKGKFKTESGARKAADEAVEKAAGWAYDEHKSERKRRKAEIVAWVKEWGPNAAPESRSGIMPPKPEEIPHVPFKKFLAQIDPDFYADFTRRAAAARHTAENETQGGITVPEEPRQGVVGELTNYDPPSQARLMVNFLAQNLSDAAAKIVRDGLAEAIKEGQVDRFLQDLQREFPQAFQPGG